MGIEPMNPFMELLKWHDGPGCSRWFDIVDCETDERRFYRQCGMVGTMDVFFISIDLDSLEDRLTF